MTHWPDGSRRRLFPIKSICLICILHDASSLVNWASKIIRHSGRLSLKKFLTESKNEHILKYIISIDFIGYWFGTIFEEDSYKSVWQDYRSDRRHDASQVDKLRRGETARRNDLRQACVFQLERGFMMKVRIPTLKYGILTAESGFNASGLLAAPEICCCRACTTDTGGSIFLPL